MKDKILVIIVTYNGLKWIGRCLSSIDSSLCPLDVLIIDNGSADSTIEYIKDNFPHMELIESSENLGFGKANNIGLDRVIKKGYDYAYLLNQDAWIFPDTIQSLISVQKKNPEFGILSPFQIQANQKNIDKNFILNVLSYNSNSKIVSDLYFQNLLSAYEVSEVMAAHWLISRKCIETVGGFSPSFPHYGEDNNYISRAKFWGFKTGIVPNSKGVHDREDRELTKHKRIYFDYCYQLIKIGNPFQNISLANILLSEVHTAITYKSLTPIFTNFFKILKSYKTLIHFKNASVTHKRAFLEEN